MDISPSPDDLRLRLDRRPLPIVMGRGEEYKIPAATMCAGTLKQNRWNLKWICRNVILNISGGLF
jgi:hypothetical protein